MPRIYSSTTRTKTIFRTPRRPPPKRKWIGGPAVAAPANVTRAQVYII